MGIVTYAICRASYINPTLLGNNVDMYLDPNGEICAGGQTLKDACTVIKNLLYLYQILLCIKYVLFQQDGGSPLVCPANNIYNLAGLVIWGKNCGQAGVYGVYVNVPFYYQWIQSKISTSLG